MNCHLVSGACMDIYFRSLRGKLIARAANRWKIDAESFVRNELLLGAGERSASNSIKLNGFEGSHIKLWLEFSLRCSPPSNLRRRSLTSDHISRLTETSIRHVETTRSTPSPRVTHSLPSSGMWWMIIEEPRKSLKDSFDRLPRTWFACGFNVPCTEWKEFLYER